MSTTEQHHSGTGDNVIGHKIYIEIKALAPADLAIPMEMVFESLRKNNLVAAKIQMDVLKALAQKDAEAAALVEAISIYGDLVDAKDHGTAWGKVSKIAASAQNSTVKDVCLAALLRLSRGTEQEETAKAYFLAEPAPGLYSNEVFLSLYADQDRLESAGAKFVISEGELTGIIEGSLRLGLIDFAVRMAKRLSENFDSYNAKVLQVAANAHALNPELAHCHLWLCSPEIKHRLDELSCQVVELLDLSEGVDTRLYNMACPIFEAYQGHAPASLFEALKRYLPHFESTYSSIAAQFKAIAGDDHAISQRQRDILAAKANLRNRATWCREFLAESELKVEDVIPFLHLATPAEITEWLSANKPIAELSEVEISFIELFGRSFLAAKQDDDLPQRHQLSEQVDIFLNAWKDDLIKLAPERIFELVENLISAKLPHKALGFTSLIVPDRDLWPSKFVLTHLQCLLEAQQYKTFDDVASRVKGAEESLTVMSFRSLKAERIGDVKSAIEISDLMLARSPMSPYCWYRGCFLRGRYQGEAEQKTFHAQIPDTLLKEHSPEVVAILYFFTMAGNFKRAEPIWVEWFLEDPHKCAIELVNFHFGLYLSERRCDFEFSPELEQSKAAFQFEQDGNTMIRLITDDHHGSSEYALKSSSQLAELLQSLTVGESGSLGLLNYKVVECLPPYIACLRIALQIRHSHNDGSDCFAMLTMPSDTEQLVPFLEEKLGRGMSSRIQLGGFDNIPLYVRGHVLYQDNALKGAMNCWTDIGFSKSPLFSQGNEFPDTVVLDAYSIGYLAVTDLAQSMLDIGISFVLPAATKEALSQWIEQISDESYMLLGVTKAGKLFRTTASDIQARKGHSLRALRLILENSSVSHPVLHDIPLEVFSIKHGIDSTVYDAMQLSSANGIPWLCMDGAFAALHFSHQHPTANVQAIIARAMGSSAFNFEQKRHGLLLYSHGAIPLPITFGDIQHLAANPNPLASIIFCKIIQNHGRQIFLGDERPIFLLNGILSHLNSFFHSGRSSRTLLPIYTPWVPYAEHVFNHGISLFLELNQGGTAEYRLALAIVHMGEKCRFYKSFFEFLISLFIDFASGHFLDFNAIQGHLRALTLTTSEKSSV